MIALKPQYNKQVWKREINFRFLYFSSYFTEKVKYWIQLSKARMTIAYSKLSFVLSLIFPFIIEVFNFWPNLFLSLLKIKKEGKGIKPRMMLHLIAQNLILVYSFKYFTFEAYHKQVVFFPPTTEWKSWSLMPPKDTNVGLDVYVEPFIHFLSFTHCNSNCLLVALN